MQTQCLDSGRKPEEDTETKRPRWMEPPLSVDAEVYAAEVRQGIDGCLDRVPTNQRMAFILR